MVARKMSSKQTSVASQSGGRVTSHIDKYLSIQLTKLQLRRRVQQPQVLIPRYVLPYFPANTCGVLTVRFSQDGFIQGREAPYDLRTL